MPQSCTTVIFVVIMKN